MATIKIDDRRKHKPDTSFAGFVVVSERNDHPFPHWCYLNHFRTLREARRFVKLRQAARTVKIRKWDSITYRKPDGSEITSQVIYVKRDGTLTVSNHECETTPVLNIPREWVIRAEHTR